jgi:enoyl-CoA hydratase/carnithine racemase
MELTGPAAVVQLPERLTPTSLASLAGAARRAFEGPAPVVALVGADEMTFCTGLALAGADDLRVDTRDFSALLAELIDAPKPTLAVVDGRAIGGGLGLAAACDWVIASERATFGLPELLWGLIPAMIWPLVTSRITEGTARRWAIENHARSATEAQAAGLVDEVAPAGHESAALRRAGRMLARLDHCALRRLRWWIGEARNCPLPAALARGAALTAEMAADPRHHARVDAFNRGEAPWD